jgi:hypothetical protein
MKLHNEEVQDLYLFTYGAEPFLRSCQFCTYLRTFQHLRNPKIHNCVHKSPLLVPILSQIDPVHTIPSLKSILLLSTHLRLGLPSGIFPSGFPTNILYAFLVSPFRALFPAHDVYISYEVIPENHDYMDVTYSTHGGDIKYAAI